MDFIEDEDVADFYVAKMGHGEQVAWGENIFPAYERGDDIFGGL